MRDAVLVTGAAGFVGGHLLEALATHDPARRVVAWRRPHGAGRGPRAARADRTPPTIVWQDVDLLDRADVHHRISEVAPTHVYHCAGIADVGGSWNNVVTTLETNVLGTEHVLDALSQECPTARMLLPGSALVYQPSDVAIAEDHPIGPVSPYGVSKLAQEMLARSYPNGPALVLTRSFTHIGPGQDPSYAISSFAHQIARIEAGQAEPIIRVGFLDSRRDLMDVRDTVKAYCGLMDSGGPGTVYNVCSGRGQKINDVLVALIDLARVPISVELDPSRLRSNDPALVLGDHSRITRDVGWEPQITLADTLRDLLHYWRRTVT